MKKEKQVKVFGINRGFILILSVVLLGFCINSYASTFESQWNKTFDRVSLGPEYWANPMEDCGVSAAGNWSAQAQEAIETYTC